MCTAMDANNYFGTHWSGTVFNCPSANSISNNKIFLPHEQFSSVARGSCNNGTIVAEGTEVNGSLYTSTLTIASITLDMNEQTIICSVSGTVIGTETLRVGGKYSSECVATIFFITQQLLEHLLTLVSVLQYHLKHWL